MKPEASIRILIASVFLFRIFFRTLSHSSICLLQRLMCRLAKQGGDHGSAEYG